MDQYQTLVDDVLTILRQADREGINPAEVCDAVDRAMEAWMYEPAEGETIQ
jgi:hypothetical protein